MDRSGTEDASHRTNMSQHTLNESEKSSEITKDKSSSSSSNSPADDPKIVYHYLTFETPLPTPSTPASPDVTPPPEPNLTPFISPFLWSTTRKTLILTLSCIATTVAAFTAGSFSPPVALMAAEWNVSQVAVLVGITTFCAGFAIAPMVLAPFSEINGRYPVFLAAGVLFEVGQLSCALTGTYWGMMVARFWTGVGASVFSTMVGGVISDMYHAEERNMPMCLFSGGALFGTGLGPLVAGFIVEHASWRWVFWEQVIHTGVLVIAVGFFLGETRGSVLLSRKAGALNKWYEEREKVGLVGFDMLSADGEKKESQRIRWKVKSDEERESITKMIKISVVRPFRTFSYFPLPNTLTQQQTSSLPNQSSSSSPSGSPSPGQSST